MSLTRGTVGKKSLLLLALYVVDVFGTCFLKKITLDLVFLHSNAVLLVILLNQLNESLKLSATIVAALTCGNVRKFLYALKVSIILVQHLSEHVADSWWSFA